MRKQECYYKTFEIKDRSGKIVGSIRPNLYDEELYKGIIALCEAIPDIADRVKVVGDINPDGTMKNAEDAPAMRAIEEQLEVRFDAAFGIGAYKEFFTDIKPFASVGGNFYCNSIIVALCQLVEDGRKKYVDKKAKRYNFNQKIKRFLMGE